MISSGTALRVSRIAGSVPTSSDDAHPETGRHMRARRIVGVRLGPLRPRHEPHLLRDLPACRNPHAVVQPGTKHQEAAHPFVVLGHVHSDPCSDELLAPAAGATGVTDSEGEKAADHHAGPDGRDGQGYAGPENHGQDCAYAGLADQSDAPGGGDYPEDSRCSGALPQLVESPTTVGVIARRQSPAHGEHCWAMKAERDQASEPKEARER